MIINPYIYGVASTYDPDAQLFFNAEAAAGVTLTTTQKDAVNQWVVDSKAAGIWTKFKAIYPMVGGTATSHKFNLKNPLDTNAAFRLVFNGGGTHSSNGYQPNGTNAYANTFLVPSANLTNNNIHLSFYSRTNSTSGNDMGMQNGITTGNPQLTLSIKSAGTGTLNIWLSTNNANRLSIANLNTQGFFIGNSNNSNTKTVYKNNTTLGSGSSTPVNVTTYNLYIGAENLTGTAGNYSNRECAFSTIGDGLTDLESQLFYQITEKYQVALGRNINALQSFYYNPAYNNETNAFLFSTQITDNTIQTATNTLVSDLKTANIFTKMKAIYPMVGGTATTHKFNLANAQDTDAAYRLVFSGGGTFSANGYQPGGVNGFANTFLSSSIMALNSGHLSYYSRTASVGTFTEMGALQSTPNSYSDLGISYSGYGAFFRYNDSGLNVSIINNDSKGFYVGARTSANVIKFYKNGATIINTTFLSNATSTNNIIIGANNNSGTAQNFTNRQCAFASIGDGLTDAEALAFYNAVNAFQVTLNRNV
jgi:hypothetical protein